MKRKRLHFETIPQKRLDFVRKKQYAFVHRLTNKEDFDNFGIMSFSPLIGNILGEYVGRMAVDLGLEIVESILVIREVFFEIIPEELRDHPMLKYMDQENYIDFVNVIIHHFEELHRKNLLQRYFAIVTKSLMDYAKKHNIKEDVARETIAGLYLSGAYL